MDSNSFGKNFVAPKNSQKLGNPQRQSTSSSYNGNSFGSNFVAPKGVSGLGSHSRPQSQRTPQRTILVKSKKNQELARARAEESAKKFFENNSIKQMIEERNRQNEIKAQEEKARNEEMTSPIEYFYNVGERVFHEKLGVGHIIDVTQIGESTMYTIDFGKMGKKAMDAAYAHLKKF